MRSIVVSAACFVGMMLIHSIVHAQPLRPDAQPTGPQIQLEPATTDGLAQKPIAIGNHPVIDQLRLWHEQGTAAGNVGDVYFNRDFRHSAIDLARFPQLRQVKLDEQNKTLHWGLFTGVMPHITIGNSSTAQNALDGGSNARLAYTNSQIINVLAAQFIHSNLFVYPEHRDYDPGLNGWGGYGDLFASNTPYLLISRGSSGSDRAFVEAIFRTLAAFQPKTKQTLRDNRMLMATVQMILRHSLKTIKKSPDYRTGLAHPAAFDGNQIDALAMIKFAQSIPHDNTPPIALLAVEGEKISEHGRDYFHPAQPEKFSTTPCSITRIYTGPRDQYWMRVSARPSLDIQNKKLSFKWVLLSGDPDLVSIKPTDNLDRSFASADINVKFHNKPWPSPADPSILTSRVDIACFAHNGTYYSQPAIISFYMPRDQRITTDDAGRVIEIGHGAYDIDLLYQPNPDSIKEHAVRDWPGLLNAMRAPDERGQLWRTLIGNDQFIAPFQRIVNASTTQDKLRDVARSRRDAARNLLNQARKAQPSDRAKIQMLDLDHREKQKQLELAESLYQKIYSDPDPDLGQSPRRFIESTLTTLIDDPELFIKHGQAALKLAPKLANIAQRLVELGILVRDADHYRITTLRQGDTPLADRLTPYERSLLQFLNYQLLNELSGNMMNPLEPAYVDPRIKLPRQWRDIYQYDDNGKITGWVRFGADKAPQHFTATGQLILEKDPQGKPTKLAPVTYKTSGNTAQNLRLEVEFGSPIDANP